MRRVLATVFGAFVSIFIVAAVNAAPTATPDKPKQPVGLKNAKKAMQYRLEQDKKMHEIRKKGQVMRQQAQSGK